MAVKELSYLEKESPHFSKVQRCRRCILPESYPAISFDHKGDCNFCVEWDKKWKSTNFSEQSNSLKGILSKFRGKTRPYDCIIGLSGGKDSCYAAFLAKELDLKPLAVTFDNGFLSESAQTNIEQIVTELSLGHIVYKFDQDFMRNLYRNCLLRTGEFCSVCNTGIRASLFRAAQSYRIRLILSGMSSRTEANSPTEFFTCSPGYFKRVSQNILSKKEIRSFRYISQGRRIIRQLLDRPHFLNLPSFVPWIEQEFIQELKVSLGIDFSMFEQHSDCRMNQAKEYLKLEKFGVLEKCAKLSSLIRDGQITREQGLSLLEKDQNRIIQRKEEICQTISSEFQISGEQLGKALNNNHMNYIPVHEKIIRRMYETLKRYKSI